jgi:toxin-antitoxin system PIN domain toxin
VTRVALLDVNVLVALFDPAHVHHELAHDWFAENAPHGWATSALTESAFVRVVSNPAYGGTAPRVAEIVDRLRMFRASGHHHYWTETLSLGDRASFDLSFLGSHRQITDVYLLGLATRHTGRLATFDRSIPIKAVVGATPEALAVISGSS